MSHKNIIFYRKKQEIQINFEAEEISSDGSIVLLEKIEREHKLIKYFSKFIPDDRHPLLITHNRYKQLRQRVYLMMLGYEDTNDVAQLRNDPLMKDILEGDLASQPTMSRFENCLDKKSIFAICEAWVDRYVKSLKCRKEVIIDIDSTDDPTHGVQQQSLFNGYYGQFMYNELFFHDGLTGQIILPVLRPGNSHSNKWYVSILKRIIKKILLAYPAIEIYIRADSGFSNSKFYEMASEYNLKYAIGMATNNVLKNKVQRAQKAVELLYASKGIKHQHFICHEYQAQSWHKAQRCYSKVESTGKGMNVRHMISNIENKSAREIYFDFYVQRGEASENRIKEVKNMCFADRLSNHGYWANFFRLFISSLAYEMFLLIREKINNTKYTIAKSWQIDTIRTRLLKIGATIRHTKRRIYYRLSKAFVYKDLFLELILK